MAACGVPTVLAGWTLAEYLAQAHPALCWQSPVEAQLQFWEPWREREERGPSDCGGSGKEKPQ